MRSTELGGTLEVISSTSLIFLIKMEKPEFHLFNPWSNCSSRRVGNVFDLFLLSHDKGVILLILISFVPS